LIHKVSLTFDDLEGKINSPVELVPPGAIAIGLCDLFNGTRRRSAHDKWNSEVSGGACRGKLGITMPDPLYPDRCNEKRRRVRRAE
jgi:hypothetical protein